jgi:integrase/recombinase XerD
MANSELFEQYLVEMKLKTRNKRNLKSEEALLKRFQDFLAEHPPTKAQAKRFIAGFTDLSAGSVLRYASTIKGFMKFCGDPLDDLKLPHPKHVASYIKEEDYLKLLAAAGQKRSQKHLIPRDQLLVKLACFSGLRRGELANLEIGDVYIDSIKVCEGKGLKDRIVPLPPAIARELNNFCEGRNANENVFGLNDVVISNKFNQWAKKAGVPLHAHLLRHLYAQALSERGVDAPRIQRLLGHSDLNTTQDYIGVSDKSLYEAVNRLEEPKIKDNEKIVIPFDLLTSVVEYQAVPAPYSNTNSFSLSYFPIEIKGKELSIESIEAIQPDPSVYYQLMLFTEKPQHDSYKWDYNDLLGMEQVNKRRYIQQLNGLRISLDDNCHQLYIGFKLSQRPINFNTEDWDEEKNRPSDSYFNAPVSIKVTLRYRQL